MSSSISSVGRKGAVPVLIALAAVAFGLGACTQGQERQQAGQAGGSGEVRGISPMEAAGALRNDFAVLVDVREESELSGGMAEPARWFPTSKISEDSPEWKKFVSSLPKDKEIILYCRSGGRASRAASLLGGKGFKTANMGGFSAWKEAGLPTRQPE